MTRKSSDKCLSVTVSMPLSLLDKLEKGAAEEGKSFSAHAVGLIKDAISSK
jgi:hypothetical protein